MSCGEVCCCLIQWTLSEKVFLNFVAVKASRCTSFWLVVIAKNEIEQPILCKDFSCQISIEFALQFDVQVHRKMCLRLNVQFHGWVCWKVEQHDSILVKLSKLN